MENLRFALRYLAKPRGGNLTRLLSLALGLTVALLVFSYVEYTLTYDRFFPHRERIYQLWTQSKTGMSSSMMAPVAPALAAELPQVEAATRLRAGFRYQLYRDGEPFDCSFAAVDTCFFDVVDFGVVRGDRKQLTGSDRIMLSESFARTLFGDRDPMGEQVMMKNQNPMTVVGIFRDIPRNNSVGRFNALVPLEYIGGSYYMGWGGGDSFPTYLKLREGTDIAEVESQMADFDRRHGLAEYNEQWNARYIFVPIVRASKTDSPVVQVAWILSGLALLILFVAAMNYVLISVSALVDRARTVAMLRCHGARRSDVAAIFLWETLLLTAAALLAAGLLIWGFQEQIGALMGVPAGELFAPSRIWVPAAVLLATLLAAGILPAAAFASVPLTTVFRGAAAGRRGWKRTLLLAQVAGVAFALTLLAVFTLQVRHLRHGDMGFDVERTVSVRPLGSRTAFRNMAEALAALPEAEAAGTTSSLPVWGYSGQPCFDETTHEMLFGCRIAWIDEYYLDAVGMRIVAGRNLTPRSTADEALVNERYCALRGWTAEEAVDRTVHSSGEASDPWPHRIVGVVRDFRTDVESGEVLPVLLASLDELMPERPGQMYGGSSICVTLRELSPEAIDAVRKKIEEWPSTDNHAVVLLGEALDGRLETVVRLRRITSVTGLVVLAITLVGLMGYLGDETRRRRREVAVRKVNGATGSDILRLFARDLTLALLPAVAAGIAAAWWASTAVLERFASRIPLAWWIFAATAAVILSVTAALVVVRTRRIVAADPVRMIQTES